MITHNLKHIIKVKHKYKFVIYLNKLKINYQADNILLMNDGFITN